MPNLWKKSALENDKFFENAELILYGAVCVLLEVIALIALVAEVEAIAHFTPTPAYLKTQKWHEMVCNLAQNRFRFDYAPRRFVVRFRMSLRFIEL